MFSKEFLITKTGLSSKEIAYYTQLGFLSPKSTYTYDDLHILYKLIMLKTIGCSFMTIATLTPVSSLSLWEPALNKHYEQICYLYGEEHPIVKFIETVLFLIKNENALNFDEIYELFLVHFYQKPLPASFSRQYMRDSLRIYSGKPLSTPTTRTYSENLRTS